MSNRYDALAFVEGKYKNSKFHCETYKELVMNDREAVISSTGKLALKAAVVGIGALMAYNSVELGQEFYEVVGLAHCSEILSATLGLSTFSVMTAILGVKDSVKDIVDSYRAFQVDLRTYESYRDEGRGRR